MSISSKNLSFNTMPIMLFYAIKNRMGLFNLLSFAIIAGSWFAAVYTRHHYVVAVVADIAIAFMGISIVRLMLAKSSAFNRFIPYFPRATVSRSEARTTPQEAEPLPSQTEE